MRQSGAYERRRDHGCTEDHGSDEGEEGNGGPQEGTLRSGSGKKVTSKRQAIAIGLSEARKAGAHVPDKRTG